MKKRCALKLLLLLFALGLIAPPSFSQADARPSKSLSTRLYRVSTRDEKSGERRFGFIDKTGKLVIGFDRLPKTTLGVGEFHEGRAFIYLKKEGVEQMDYTMGYIDETGDMVIPAHFRLARDFSEGLAYVEQGDTRGFIDRAGRLVIKVDGYAQDFHEGLAAVATARWSKDWGYIDRAGRTVIKRQYEFADDFSEGLAGVVVDRKYGFINRRGEMVIAPRFDIRRGEKHSTMILSSGRFHEGLACVRENALYGYINRKGEFAIPLQFLEAQDFSEGLAWVVRWDEQAKTRDKVGWIDKSGRWVVTGVRGLIFSEGTESITYSNRLMDWRYSDGLMPFFIYEGNRTLWGYMDKRGEVAIEPREFAGAWPFVGGIARVAFDTNDPGFEKDYGYIDKKGRIIWRSKPER